MHHQVAHRAFVYGDCAQAVAHWRLRNGLRTDHSLAEIVGEGDAEHFAIRALDEADFDPAVGAEANAPTSQDAATGAGCRIEEVAQPPQPAVLSRRCHAAQMWRISGHGLTLGFTRRHCATGLFRKRIFAWRRSLIRRW